MVMPPSDVGPTEDPIIVALIEELRRRGLPTNMLAKAEEMLSEDESRDRILEATRIDRDKIKEATIIRNEIDLLTNEIISLRYRVNEASKIIGKRIFQDNTETGRISHELKNRQVIDQDSLHLFIDDLHKYLIQSATWGLLYKNEHVNPTLKIIESYRNSFNHIYDMKSGGSGSESAYKRLGEINEDLLGHKVIKIEEYPHLQIRMLEKVKEMLEKLEKNIEDWLR
jgi:hypothetical protein